jgi:hypothetical protein
VALLAAACGSPVTTTAPPTPIEQPVRQTMPTVAPVPGPAPSLKLPDTERRTLANGLQVI